MKILVSFDIDGLNPYHCYDTGTPVPGGFSLEDIVYLLQKISKSGHKIIGIDMPFYQAKFVYDNDLSLVNVIEQQI